MGSLIYRIRRYEAVSENLAVFHDFFNEHLLPVQAEHGARIVGRWETDDHEVVAVWEYDDEASYQRIEASVRNDPKSARAQVVRAVLPPLFTARHESFARSTLRDA